MKTSDPTHWRNCTNWSKKGCPAHSGELSEIIISEKCPCYIFLSHKFLKFLRILTVIIHKQKRRHQMGQIEEIGGIGTKRGNFLCSPVATIEFWKWDMRIFLEEKAIYLHELFRLESFFFHMVSEMCFKEGKSKKSSWPVAMPLTWDCKAGWNMSRLKLRSG